MFEGIKQSSKYMFKVCAMLLLTDDILMRCMFATGALCQNLVHADAVQKDSLYALCTVRLGLSCKRRERWHTSSSKPLKEPSGLRS